MHKKSTSANRKRVLQNSERKIEMVLTLMHADGLPTKALQHQTERDRGVCFFAGWFIGKIS